MAKSLDMTVGKPSKLLLQFAIPLIIGNLFQQAYTLADRVIVGQFVGADAYSAVGATTAHPVISYGGCCILYADF